MLEICTEKVFIWTFFQLSLFWLFVSRENSKRCQCNRLLKFHAEAETTKNGIKKPKQLKKLTNGEWDHDFHTKSEQEGALGQLINDALV